MHVETAKKSKQRIHESENILLIPKEIFCANANSFKSLPLKELQSLLVIVFLERDKEAYD